MYTIEATKHFLRQSGKFLKKHPELRSRFEEVVEAMRHDPFHPSLRLHQLGGKLADFHAISLTRSYRITLTLQITEKEIILLDIGSHDEVY